MNHFPHSFMTTNRVCRSLSFMTREDNQPTQRSLPMSLVCTFVAIVTRLGLRAAPVGFPGHVHAWVALPGTESDNVSTDWEDDTPTKWLAVDVAYSGNTPILHSDALRHTLDMLGVPESQRRPLISPASAAEVSAI
jgi:hypothetical protein